MLSLAARDANGTRCLDADNCDVGSGASGALQDTSQLPTDFQVQRTEKYPFPQYERMTADQLAGKAMQETNIVTCVAK